jgi:hypothetical protein
MRGGKPLKAVKWFTLCAVLAVVVGIVTGTGRPVQACAASPPWNLAATSHNNAIKLTWLPPQTLGGLTLTGYYVFRATAPGGYNWNSPLHDFATKDCYYLDQTAQAGRTYYYVVKAFFTNNDSTTPSNEVSCTVGQAGVVITVDCPTAYVNGVPVTLEAPPTLVNGRVLVPFRFLADALKASITWEEATQRVQATFGGVTVVLTVGVQSAYVNEAMEEIDVPPQLKNGRVLVPLRFLTEHFGWQAKWDSSSSSATITSTLK